LTPEVYFLDTDVVTEIGTGHAINAAAKEVISSLWKHYKMRNPGDREGETPASSASPYS